MESRWLWSLHVGGLKAEPGFGRHPFRLDHLFNDLALWFEISELARPMKRS